MIGSAFLLGLTIGIMVGFLLVRGFIVWVEQVFQPLQELTRENADLRNQVAALEEEIDSFYSPTEETEEANPVWDE
jgi:phosphate uptake regulator